VKFVKLIHFSKRVSQESYSWKQKKKQITVSANSSGIWGTFQATSNASRHCSWGGNLDSAMGEVSKTNIAALYTLRGIQHIPPLGKENHRLKSALGMGYVLFHGGYWGVSHNCVAKISIRFLWMLPNLFDSKVRRVTDLGAVSHNLHKLDCMAAWKIHHLGEFQFPVGLNQTTSNRSVWRGPCTLNSHGI